MGKVSTRKRGKTWQYYFQLASVNGTRKWKTGSGYRTKAEAQAAGTKALAEYNSTGIAFKVSEQSVADYFDYWMEHYVEQELAETTVNTYKKRIRLYIKPCNGVQREHNKKLNNGLPILHKVPPKRDYGRYFCIMAEKGGTSHGGLTEKLSPFFHAKKQEVNAYGR